MAMSEPFGKRVRAAREANGLSQERLAELAGTTQSTIDRIESGFTSRSRYMHDVARLLNLDVAVPSADTAQKESMVDRLQRRNYILTSELLDRVKLYQWEYDVISEDEAIRMLIEAGLNQNDRFYTLTERLVKRYNEKRSFREAARYVLSNHPLVKIVEFGDEYLRYSLEDGYTVKLRSDGKAVVWDDKGDLYEHAVNLIPDWAADENIDPQNYRG